MPDLLVALAQIVTIERKQDEGPILSSWYGHAGKTPQALPPSTYQNSPIHHIGFHQSVEWIDTMARYGTPMVPLAPSGRSKDTRLYDLRKVKLDSFAQDQQWLHCEELPQREAAAIANAPSPKVIAGASAGIGALGGESSPGT